MEQRNILSFMTFAFFLTLVLSTQQTDARKKRITTSKETTKQTSNDNNPQTEDQNIWTRVAYLWQGLNNPQLPPAKIVHAQELLKQLIQEITAKWTAENPDKVMMIKCIQAPCINPHYPQLLQVLIKAEALLQQNNTETRARAAQLLADELKENENRVQTQKNMKQNNGNKKPSTKRQKLVDTANAKGAEDSLYAYLKNINKGRTGIITEQDLISEEIRNKIPKKVKRSSGQGGETVYALPNGTFVNVLEWVRANPDILIPETVKRKGNPRGGALMYKSPDGKFVYAEKWFEIQNKK